MPVVLGWLIRRLRSKGWSFRAEPTPVKATGLAAAADAGGGDDGACLQTPLNGTYTEDGRSELSLVTTQMEMSHSIYLLDAKL